MSNTPSSLYLAQAFHHGDPEHHGYVVAIGSKDAVHSLALAEHARRGGEYGIAIYKVTLDTNFQDKPHLALYLSSVMGERWSPD